MYSTIPVYGQGGKGVQRGWNIDTSKGGGQQIDGIIYDTEGTAIDNLRLSRLKILPRYPR